MQFEYFSNVLCYLDGNGCPHDLSNWKVNLIPYDEQIGGWQALGIAFSFEFFVIAIFIRIVVDLARLKKRANSSTMLDQID